MRVFFALRHRPLPRSVFYQSTCFCFLFALREIAAKDKIYSREMVDTSPVERGLSNVSTYETDLAG